jgi:hypothetical protein
VLSFGINNAGVAKNRNGGTIFRNHIPAVAMLIHGFVVIQPPEGLLPLRMLPLAIPMLIYYFPFDRISGWR